MAIQQELGNYYIITWRRERVRQTSPGYRRSRASKKAPHTTKAISIMALNAIAGPILWSGTRIIATRSDTTVTSQIKQPKLKWKRRPELFGQSRNENRRVMWTV